MALQAIIAVAQNKKEAALELANKAVDLGPQSAVAQVALSCAQQAMFDLEGALASLQEAVKLAPLNALAWARLAELWLSFGYLDRALEAARTAVSLNPDLARTQSVLGFAHLTQIEIEDAKKAFHQAIALDQGDPMPRLGLGLANIRDGDLHAGRVEIEIAASLDPSNSLVRSYLGKAYFDEKRTGLDGTQYAIAKELDPLDPTPYFYDAILKQTTNRPVEALHDLQKSIELNDNRAVYRSRLLLDQDLAARSTGLGRIFRDLGFGQLALVEGWRSVNVDPGNFSAHRLLSDLYSSLPRHEVARVSELLQSQLLQPINIAPVPPQLSESNLFILEGLGPSEPSTNEFNPLFNRNRFALQADGVSGNHGILGDDLVQSAVWGKWSYSLGQFHYESNGYRQNNDLNEDIYNAFVQTSLSYSTSVQAEWRYRKIDKGDLSIRFDPDDFNSFLKQKEDMRSGRLGLQHVFTPQSRLIASFIYAKADADVDVYPGIAIKSDEDGYTAEIQHLYQSDWFSVVSGAGRFDADRKDKLIQVVESTEKGDITQTNLYAYSLVAYPDTCTWTIGASADFFDGLITDRNQLNPKFGLTWNPFPDTTLRAAVFKTLRRALISNQTIEPTQVAGFNQFYEDADGTESWFYGFALDQKFSNVAFGGLEFAKRDLTVSYSYSPSPFEPIQTRRTGWEDHLARAYLYWTPLNSLALSAEYQYERLERDALAPGPEDLVEAKTHRVPLAISWFDSLGLRARLTATYVHQEGDFGSAYAGVFSGDDHFWVVDAAIGYRLPKRFGLLTIEARNLFDEGFKFQDTDPANPRIVPERSIIAKITLAF